MKVLVFIFIVFSFLGVSAEENMSIEKEYDVVCSIYNGGRHNSNKALLRYNRILLQVTELMVSVVDVHNPQCCLFILVTEPFFIENSVFLKMVLLFQWHPI